MKRKFHFTKGTGNQNAALDKFNDSEKRFMLDFGVNKLKALMETKPENKFRIIIDDNEMLKSNFPDKLTPKAIDEIDIILELTEVADNWPLSDLEGRIKAYKKILKIAPWDSITVMSIGVQYFRMDDINNAVVWLKKAKKMDPNNERIRKNLQAVLY